MKNIAIAFTALAMVIGPVSAMAQNAGAAAQSGSSSNSGAVAGSNSSSQGGTGGTGGSAYGQGGTGGSGVAGAAAQGGVSASGASITTNNYNSGRTTTRATGGYSNTNTAAGGYNNTSQVKYSGSYSISNVPGVVAPALTTTLTETCMGSTSIGGAGVGFGVSFGTTWRDTACVRRLDARQLLALGHSDAATELMCDSEAVKGAFRRVGRPCAEEGYVVAKPVPTPRVSSAEYGMSRVASAPSGGIDAYRKAMSQCGDTNYSACMRDAKKHLN